MKRHRKNRLFEHICPGLVLKDGGLRLTFYRNMPNNSSAIFTNGIVDKSKPDLKRSANMSLGHEEFSTQTLTLTWHSFVLVWFRSVV